MGKLIRKALLLTVAALATAACGGGGDNTVTSTPNPPSVVQPPGDPGTDPVDPGTEILEVQLSGSVGDGPIVGATVRVYAADGTVLSEFDSVSSPTADYEMTIKTQGKNYPLTVVATGGTDLVTGAAPDFSLEATLMRPSSRVVANLNPFTTLVVATARELGEVSDQTLSQAQDTVSRRYGYGLDLGLIPDVMGTAIDETTVANVVKSSETAGEALRRTRDALQSAGGNVSADDVIAAMASDLTDGVLDGQGGPMADGQVAAVANAASAQVLLEAYTNRLSVYGADAMTAMDSAIATVRPSATVMTSEVAIPAEGLEQA
ncbi:MAG: hypothetical protein P8102_14425, partial [Gammaproteobacteria bacterium]